MTGPPLQQLPKRKQQDDPYAAAVDSAFAEELEAPDDPYAAAVDSAFAAAPVEAPPAVVEPPPVAPEPVGGPAEGKPTGPPRPGMSPTRAAAAAAGEAPPRRKYAGPPRPGMSPERALEAAADPRAAALAEELEASLPARIVQTEKVRAYASTLSVGERVGNAANSFMQSAVGMTASTLGGVAVLAKELDELFGTGSYEGKEASELATAQAGEVIRRWAEKTFPDDPQLRGAFLDNVLPSAFGSGVTFLATGGVAAALRGSSLAAAGTLGSLVETGATYEEAKASGATEEVARQAALLALPLGALEAIPAERQLNRFLNAYRGGRRGQILKAMVAGGGEEAIQEGIQTVGGNVIARTLYDSERELLEDLGSSTAAGLIVGGTLSGGAAAVGQITGRKKDPDYKQLLEDVKRDPEQFRKAGFGNLVDAVEAEAETEDAYDAATEQAFAEPEPTAPPKEPVEAKPPERPAPRTMQEFDEEVAADLRELEEPPRPVRRHPEVSAADRERLNLPRIWESREEVPEGVETERLAGGQHQEIISEPPSEAPEPGPAVPPEAPTGEVVQPPTGPAEPPVGTGVGPARPVTEVHSMFEPEALVEQARLEATRTGGSKGSVRYSLEDAASEARERGDEAMAERYDKAVELYSDQIEQEMDKLGLIGPFEKAETVRAMTTDQIRDKLTPGASRSQSEFPLYLELAKRGVLQEFVDENLIQRPDYVFGTFGEKIDELRVLMGQEARGEPPARPQPRQPRTWESKGDVPEGIETERLVGGRRQEILPTEEAPERIVGVAVRFPPTPEFPEGEVVEGASHPSIFMDRGFSTEPEGAVQGFVAGKGRRFVGRKEGETIAEAGGQIEPLEPGEEPRVADSGEAGLDIVDLEEAGWTPEAAEPAVEVGTVGDVGHKESVVEEMTRRRAETKPVYDLASEMLSKYPRQEALDRLQSMEDAAAAEGRDAEAELALGASELVREADPTRLDEQIPVDVTPPAKPPVAPTPKELPAVKKDEWAAITKDEGIGEPEKDYRANEEDYLERIDDALKSGRVTDARALFDEGFGPRQQTEINARVTAAEKEAATQTGIFVEEPVAAPSEYDQAVTRLQRQLKAEQWDDPEGGAREVVRQLAKGEDAETALREAFVHPTPELIDDVTAVQRLTPKKPAKPVPRETPPAKPEPSEDLGQLAAEARRIAEGGGVPGRGERELKGVIARDIEAGNLEDARLLVNQLAETRGEGETKRDLEALVRKLDDRIAPKAGAGPVAPAERAAIEQLPQVTEEILERPHALRRGVIEPGQPAHFSEPGSSTFYDLEGEGLVVYDMSGVRIADPEDTAVYDALIEQRLKDKAGLNPDQLRRVEALAALPVEERMISYIESEELGLAESAEKLGYDGLRVWENDDINEPSTLNIWNTKKVQPIARTPISAAVPVAPPAAEPQIPSEEAPSETRPIRTTPSRPAPAEPAGGVPRPPAERPTGEVPPGPRPKRGPDEGAAPERPGGEAAVQPGGVEERPGDVEGVSGKDRGGAGARGPRPGAKPGPRGTDYRVSDPSDLRVDRSPKQKVVDNIAAIRLLKEIEAAGRLATHDEQVILAQYAGWGFAKKLFDRPHLRGEYRELGEEVQGLLTEDEYDAASRSVINAHFTGPDVIQAMWDALRHMGYRGGRMLKPGMGVGYFMQLAPRDLAGATRFTGVELDEISGRIAKLLFPQSDIRVQGFEEMQGPPNFFDVALGNIPFGKVRPFDPKFKQYRFTIHNYFFAKAIEQVRPGGVVMFVTSRFTMDSFKNNTIRQFLDDRADLLAAVRLPNTAFKKVAGTEVTTDIIVLRKRYPGEPPSGESWLKTETQGSGDARYNLNEYYLKHPEMMMGNMETTGTMYGKQEATLAPISGANLATQLAAALETLPRDVLVPIETTPTDVQSPATIQAPDTVKEGAFAIENGKLMRRLNGQLVPARTKPTDKALQGKAITGTALARVKQLIGIRDAAREVLGAQLAGATDDVVKGHQKELGKLYDRFVRKFGPINKRSGNQMPNLQVFREDPDAPFVANLEIINQKANTFTKADIFTKRVIPTHKPIEHAEKPEDALLAVLNEKGRVDLDRMSQISGLTKDELVEGLGGLIYQNPATAQWESRNLYLSGNVRVKLAEAQSAAKADPVYKPNIKALEAVQPEDLPPSQITASLGASWIPEADVTQFMRDLVNAGQPGIKANHSRAIATWTVSATNQIKGLVKSTTEWGTEYVPFPRMVELALNQKQPEVRTPNGDGTSSLNGEATLAAQQKQEEIKARFADWVWEDAKRAERLHRIYNDEMNNTAPYKSDGSHQTFPGAATVIEGKPFKLHQHQMDAVWRVQETGNTGLFHAVGAGKTYTQAAIAMESKRVGLAHKPMILVLDHLLEQFTKQALDLYPAAKILMATREDLAKENRRAFIAKVANNDWDMVIMTHPSFQRIPISGEFETRFLRQQLTVLEEAIRERSSAEAARSDRAEQSLIRQIETAKANLETRIKELENRDIKDDLLSFEEMGVDMLLVDESQEFKNLYAPTRMRGLAHEGSQRAMDLYMKTRYLNERTPGRGIIFATGTPLTKSIVEMFTLQRYMSQETLVEMGMESLDAWIGSFGNTETKLELRPEGGFRQKSRIASFRNAPELSKQFQTFADIQTHDMLKLPRPDLVGGQPRTIVAQPSPEFLEYQERLMERAEHIRGAGRPGPGDDNMLNITTDGGKAALDMRLIDPSLPDFPGSKINLAVEEIFKIWESTKAKSSTQTVFIDSSTPQPKRTGAPKGMQIWTSGEGYVHVPTATRITLEGFEEFEFVVHKGIGRKGWSVTELSTGSRVGNGRIKGDAIQNAKDVLGDWGIERTREAVEKGVATRAELEPTLAQPTTPGPVSTFNVYDDMKAKLIARGIPKSEIAFIHDAKNRKEKFQLFGRVRSGEVRVLFGSTGKMGTGMNVQDKMIAQHQLDVTWNPDGMEQRLGRLQRQGNENKDVHLVLYVTEKSFDGYRYQTNERKARTIDQMVRAEVTERTIEDVDGRALTFAEIKAIVTGDPIVLEMAQIDADMGRLARLQKVHLDREFQMRRDLSRIPDDRKRAKESKARALADIKRRVDTKGDKFTITLEGKTYEKRKDAMAVIQDIQERILMASEGVAKQDWGDGRQIGTFAGFDLWAQRAFDGSTRVLLRGEGTYTSYLKQTEGVIQTIEYLPKGPESTVKWADEELADLATKEADLKRLVGEPFKQAEQLERLVVRHREITDHLDMDKAQSDMTGGGDVTAPPTQQPPEDPQFLINSETVEPGDPSPSALGDITLEQRVRPPDGLEMPAEEFGADLFDLARQLETPARYKHLRNAFGRFQPAGVAGEIELMDVNDVFGLAHEVSHALDYRLSGDTFPSSIKARFGSHVPTGITEQALRAELAMVAQMMRPVPGNQLSAYRRKHTELMADFYALYLLSPDQAASLAPNVTEAFRGRLAAKPKLHDIIQTTLQRRAAAGPAITTPEIRPAPQPTSLVPDDIEGDYTDAAKALAKGVPRMFRLRKTEAGKNSLRWEKELTERELEDVGGAAEKIGNLRTGETWGEIEGRLTPAMRKVTREYRHAQEHLRQTLNEFVREIHGDDYIRYVEDYLLHVYVRDQKMARKFASRWSRRVPSAKARRFPTLQEAVDAGFTPLTQNVAELHRLWAEMNWRGAINQRFVYELKDMINEDGLPVLMKPKDAPPEWPVVDHPAIRRVYARKLSSGVIELWHGGAAIDPEVYKATRQVFEEPFRGKIVRIAEMFNAFAKKAALSFSLFHHWALTESAQGALARIWNPLRGIVMVERGLRGGVPLGFGVKVTQPHREGLRLMENKDFVRDLILAGVNIDPIPDVMVGHVRKALAEAEVRVRRHPVLGKIPGLTYLVRAARKFNAAWDHVLWERYYTGLKALTYYSLVSEQMRGMPEDATPAKIRGVKEKVASLVNDMFGGQEWEGHFWLRPKGRQVMHWLILAPDWTISNIRVASRTISPGTDAQTRKMLIRYWRNMLATFFGFIATAGFALTRKWPWENEPGHKMDIDVTPIMKKLPWTDPDDPRRYYIRPGKQFREVTRYLSSPVDIVGPKMSPLMHVFVEQMTGHQAGQWGWEMPWVRDELRWYEDAGARIASVMEKFQPFAFRGNNFAFTFPMSRGMSWYKAQKAYEHIIQAQVDPSLYRRLMPKQDAERLKKEIDDAATLNGLDPKDLYKQGNTMVRTKYYGLFWRALEDSDMKKAERYAEILVELGVTDRTAAASAERRGVSAEGKREAGALFPSERRGPQGPRPPRKPQPPRRR